MRVLALLLILPLAGCASDGAGPSLAKRAIEMRSMDEPVQAVTPTPPADQQLAVRIAEVLARAREGQKAFSALLSPAREAAAAAGPEGSEAWIRAQQLVSAAERARAPSTASLAELDELIPTRLAQGTEAGLAELQAANAQVAEMVEQQQAELNRLRESLSR
jgi:hypothetical protein